MKKRALIFTLLLTAGLFATSVVTPAAAENTENAAFTVNSDSAAGSNVLVPAVGISTGGVSIDNLAGRDAAPAQPTGEAAVSSGADDFLLFAEEAKVMTASRLAPREESNVAAEIITAEEIRASGALNFWDVIRFRAGVDVIDARVQGGNRAVVSVRGFPQTFVSNLQVLVDGRSVYSSMVGGVFWEQIPVQLQDIERIEIIRGPNSALYGSNAGLGVINIITKKPAGKAGVSVVETGGSRGTFSSAVSLQGGNGALAYGLSHTYLTTGGNIASAGGGAPLRSNKFNFRGNWETGERSTLELYAGDSGDNGGSMASGNTDSRQNFQTVKFTAGQGAGAAIEITASRSEATEAEQSSWSRLDARTAIRHRGAPSF